MAPWTCGSGTRLTANRTRKLLGDSELAVACSENTRDLEMEHSLVCTLLPFAAMVVGWRTDL
jgi:hypothetical protein